MDPWIINDMINQDEFLSSSSANSDISSPISPISRQSSTVDLTKVYIPQDKVIRLINALVCEPKAFIKPQTDKKD